MKAAHAVNRDVAKTRQCHLASAPRAQPSGAMVKKASRSLLTILLSILIAFFPKCPVCWATYMSMFGSVWLAQTPYVAWLFPVLLALSGLNLLLLLRGAPRKGYGPFLLSLAGIVVILGGRSLFPLERWLFLIGMSLMFLSSLLNSFLVERSARRPWIGDTLV
jgi:hypothetical protein